MKTLQEEIYNTFNLWKQDQINEEFYDELVKSIAETNPKQKENYLAYWTSLKANYLLKQEYGK